MIKKYATQCCALCQLCLGNNEPIENIAYAVAALKNEATAMDYGGTPNDFGGQRAAFVITTPDEVKLAENLQVLGFERTFSFDRRKGYAAGTLLMWIINL